MLNKWNAATFDVVCRPQNNGLQACIKKVCVQIMAVTRFLSFSASATHIVASDNCRDVG